jgi:hypothetical protein
MKITSTKGLAPLIAIIIVALVIGTGIVVYQSSKTRNEAITTLTSTTLGTETTSTTVLSPTTTIISSDEEQNLKVSVAYWSLEGYTISKIQKLEIPGATDLETRTYITINKAVMPNRGVSDNKTFRIDDISLLKVRDTKGIPIYPNTLKVGDELNVKGYTESVNSLVDIVDFNQIIESFATEITVLNRQGSPG